MGTIRSIGGGAKNDFWLHMKADVLGLSVEKHALLKVSTLGAALLAALGHGYFTPSYTAIAGKTYPLLSPTQTEASRMATMCRRLSEIFDSQNLRPNRTRCYRSDLDFSRLDRCRGS